MQKFTLVFTLASLVSLSPAWATIPPDYYAETANLGAEALARKLSTLSTQGHRPLSYREVWTALQQTDEDPDNPQNILTLYSGQSLPKFCKVGRSNRHCRNSWNREHIWPKSHGFPKAHQWAYTDLHHLRAATPGCNSARGNLDFADGGLHVTGCASRKSDTWEPPQAVKGDIARMLFYMAVRYDGNTRFDRTPDLRLVDRTTRNRRARLGKLCTLLRWHQNDPVSAQERQRNERVAQLQGNRNPFIDEPAFAQRLWGKTCA